MSKTLAEDRCRTEVPELREMPRDVGSGSVACHLVTDGGSGPDVRETAEPADQHGTESPAR
jgi:hypothetical protein